MYTPSQIFPFRLMWPEMTLQTVFTHLPFCINIFRGSVPFLKVKLPERVLSPVLIYAYDPSTD